MVTGGIHPSSDEAKFDQHIKRNIDFHSVMWLIKKHLLANYMDHTSDTYIWVDFIYILFYLCDLPLFPFSDPANNVSVGV